MRGLTKALLKSRFGLAAAFVSGRRQDDRAAVATLNAADLQIMDSAGRAGGFLFPPAGLEAKIDRLKREVDWGGAFWRKAVAHTPMSATAAIHVARL